jgi:hypothetical protein
VKNQPAAAANLDTPLSRFPLWGKAGAGGFPPRRRHATRQQKTLARIDAAGSPHKRAAAPLCIPCERMLGQMGDQEIPERFYSARKTNFSVDTTGLLMEAVTKGSGQCA